MKHLRHLLVGVGLLLVLAAANRDILHKQQVVDGGRQLLLELRPVDPRSLMAGDYMQLRYAEHVFPPQGVILGLGRRGTIILTLDANGVGRFARLDDGAPLRPGELRLRFKGHRGSRDLSYGAESFFFQEGSASRYEAAKYGVLRVDDNGDSILVALAGEDRQPIGMK